MQQLRVTGVEDGALILESAEGERFRVPLDSLPGRTPQSPSVSPRQRKTSPKDVQALIRGGLTAEEVAASTGEDIAYVQRFESPVLAERAHVLQTALSIPVASGDIDPLAGETTFGAAVEERLTELGATGRNWDARKDSEGGAWSIRLHFTTEAIEHEAVWSWEPKKATLTPRGKEATSLSQAGDATSVLVPRLRAIDRQERPAAPAAAESPEPESAAPRDSIQTDAPPIAQKADPKAVRARSRGTADDGASGGGSTGVRSRGTTARNSTGRFDSDAFRSISRGSTGAQPATTPAPRTRTEDANSSEPAPSAATPSSRAESPWLQQRSGGVGTQPEGVQAAAISRPAAATQPNHTAELLDALRRRRSEREENLRMVERAPDSADSVAEDEEALFGVAAEANTGTAGSSGRTAQDGAGAPGAASPSKKRGGRAAMPSWDEIVFGSRGEDDR